MCPIKPNQKIDLVSAALELKKQIKYSISREEKFSIAVFFLTKNVLGIKVPDSLDQEQMITLGKQIQSSMSEEQKINLELRLSNELYVLLFYSDECSNEE